MGKSASCGWALYSTEGCPDTAYLAGIAALIVGGIALPFSNELLRCIRASKEPKYIGACKPDPKS